MKDEDQDENFFEKFGLEVQHNEVIIGNTYPIYGMITKFIDDSPGSVVVELNYKIEAKMLIDDTEKINLLKERSFEPGIFVSTVSHKDTEKIVVECTTVVFGRKNNQKMN